MVKMTWFGPKKKGEIVEYIVEIKKIRHGMSTLTGMETYTFVLDSFALALKTISDHMMYEEIKGP